MRPLKQSCTRRLLPALLAERKKVDPGQVQTSVQADNSHAQVPDQ
jgi:hypothetical protein